VWCGDGHGAVRGEKAEVGLKKLAKWFCTLVKQGKLHADPSKQSREIMQL